MVTEQKKRAINRLQSMRPLRANIDKTYTRMVEASKAGKPTAWCQVNWWQADPVLLAMDVEVIYPENYGAVCAAAGVAQSYLGGSDAAGFPLGSSAPFRSGFQHVPWIRIPRTRRPRGRSFRRNRCPAHRSASRVCSPHSRAAEGRSRPTCSM